MGEDAPRWNIVDTSTPAEDVIPVVPEYETGEREAARWNVPAGTTLTADNVWVGPQGEQGPQGEPGLTDGMVNVLSYGATGDGVTDDTAAIQEAIDDALAFGSTLHVPTGTYRTTDTLTISVPTSFKMVGDGGTTIFEPDAFSGAAISVNTNENFHLQQCVFEDFRIHAGTLTSGQFGFAFTPTSGTTGLRLRGVYVDTFDVGVQLMSTQFCVFERVAAASCNIGLELHQDVTAGGTNNNSFYDCIFSYNEVGVFIKQDSAYPMGSNAFFNLVSHANAVCAVYAENQYSVSLDNWAPEANCAGVATYVYDGSTVKNSILHAVGSLVNLRQYANESLVDHIYAETGSIVNIDGGAGGYLIPVADATSLVSFTASGTDFYGGTGSSVYTCPPLCIPSPNSHLMTAPVLIDTSWLTNDAIAATSSDVERGYSNAGTTATAAYVEDAEMGEVMQFTFGDGQIAIVNTAAADYTTVGTTIAASYLAKSSSANAVWDLNFGQGTAYGRLQLPADQWVRIVQYGELAYTPRSANIAVSPYADAVGETLAFCKLHTVTNLESRMLARFIRDGLYNSGKSKLLRYIPEVTGDRSDGVALTNLLTALETLGLITDSTTA